MLETSFDVRSAACLVRVLARIDGLVWDLWLPRLCWSFPGLLNVGADLIDIILGEHIVGVVKGGTIPPRAHMPVIKAPVHADNNIAGPKTWSVGVIYVG